MGTPIGNVSANISKFMLNFAIICLSSQIGFINDPEKHHLNKIFLRFFDMVEKMPVFLR